MGPPPVSSLESNSPAPDHLDDLELIRRARAGVRGDVDVLAKRLVRVQSMLTGINRRRGGPLDPHDLEDLSQDVLIQIWKRLPSFHGHGSLEGWLYRFCWLEFVNRLRRSTRGPRQEHLSGEPTIEGSGDDEAMDQLVAQIARLPEAEAAVVELRLLDELPFDVIARKLNVPRGTAKTRYYSGVTRLRSYLRSLAQKEEV